MSVGFTEFFCTACDFSASSMVVWGEFSYRTPAGLIPLRREVGWCSKCATVTAVEVLPSPNGIKAARSELSRWEDHVRSLAATADRDRSWIAKVLRLRSSQSDELQQAESRAYFLRSELEGDEARLAALTHRRAGPRCLKCGAENAQPLPAEHPNCGGEPVGTPSDIQFNLALAHRICDLEGNELEQRSVS